MDGPITLWMGMIIEMNLQITAAPIACGYMFFNCSADESLLTVCLHVFSSLKPVSSSIA